jgi:hypothetical protein
LKIKIGRLENTNKEQNFTTHPYFETTAPSYPFINDKILLSKSIYLDFRNIYSNNQGNIYFFRKNEPRSNDSINLYFSNFRSLCNKLTELKVKYVENNFDILVGNET